MKTWCITILLGLFAFKCAEAQYVNIPDGNFLLWLDNSSVSGCIVGSQLDTTCQALLSDTIVICRSSEISDLDGIQYFKSLRYLDCSINSLTSLPPLPDSLIMLDCSSNQLLHLPALPNSVERLYCAANQLLNLPVLSSELRSLYCNGNQLDSLPSFPSNLDTLNCFYNSITYLPSFPATLIFLNCQQNQITTLPNGVSLKYIDCDYNAIVTLGIYDSLQQLNCDNNQIQRLPVLPNSLAFLSCDNNNIDSIIYLPNSINELSCNFNQLKSLGSRLPDSLEVLSCGNNLLTVLPALPKALTNFSCNNNLVTAIPELPDSMENLACNNNPNLQCLPKLTRINYLFFDSTAITCLPNYGDVTTSTPPLNGVPLCVTDNQNGCPVYTGITEIKPGTIKIYPNPANEYINIDINSDIVGIQLSIMDDLGNELMKYRVLNTETQIPVSSLANGFYFVKITDAEGRTSVDKMVKE